MGRDPFAAACETELFGGRGLDVDATARHLADMSKVGHHLRYIRSELGFLGDDRGIEITDPETPCLGEADHMLQQQQTVDALICRIRIGKIAPDISQAKCAENGI